MSRRALPLALFLVPVLLWTSPAQQQDAPTKSAFETNNKKWDDLVVNLKEWKRVVPGKGKLPAKSPWKATEQDILVSTGTSTPEALLLDKVQTNGILHFEWRAKKGDTRAGCGVYLRTSADGAIWHLAYAGPSGGSISGMSQSDGKPLRVDPKKTQLPGPGRLKPAGEWNVTEVTAKDKTLAIWTNGYSVAEWAFCDVSKGYVGFQAGSSPIEYRNLKFKKIR